MFDISGSSDVIGHVTIR